MEQIYRVDIPDYCLNFFMKRFSNYPCIIELNNTLITDKIKTYFEKYHIIWFKEYYSENGTINKEEILYEYDSTGIMVYINKNNSIFILTLTTKKNVSEFLINTLKRIK